GREAGHDAALADWTVLLSSINVQVDALTGSIRPTVGAAGGGDWPFQGSVSEVLGRRNSKARRWRLGSPRVSDRAGWAGEALAGDGHRNGLSAPCPSRIGARTSSARAGRC